VLLEEPEAQGRLLHRELKARPPAADHGGGNACHREDRGLALADQAVPDDRRPVHPGGDHPHLLHGTCGSAATHPQYWGIAERRAESLANRLLAARASGEPIELLTETEAFGEELAYAVQDLVVQGLCAGGKDSRVGYKIAMTSPETMALANAREPAYGVLTRSMVLASPAIIALSDLYQPRLEAELVFLIDADLPPAAGPDEIVRAARVAAGLEIPSARYRDWFGRMPIPDLVSDDTAAGRLVVAGGAVPADGLALDRIEMRLRHEGREVQHGLSSVVLGSPILAVAWLTRALAARGRSLRAGELVSSGTFGLPLPAASGRWEAGFSGIGSASAVFR